MITVATSTPISALNRVNTLARMICWMVREGAGGTALTRPAAVRSATSAAVNPRVGSITGDIAMPV